MNPILMWFARKTLEALAFEIPFKKWQAEFHEKQRAEREKKEPPAGGGIIGGAAVILVCAFLSIGASCNPPQWVPQPGDIPDLKVYCCDSTLGHPDRCSQRMKDLLCAAPTPAPFPVVTPTATPSATPTVTPTSRPTPTPAPTVQPTPAPCSAAPPAPLEPVSVLFTGHCPKGGEEIADSGRWAPPGKVICAAKSTCELDGHAACPGIGDRASWAFSYNLNQGQELKEFNGKFLIYDAQRGCKDFYGRFFHERQDCQVLYTHPTDPNAQWTYTGMAPAAECPAPPPPPASGACALPEGTGDGTDCPRTSPRLLAGVTEAIARVEAARPDLFESPGVVAEHQELAFYAAVVVELGSLNYCAVLDPSGTELAVKNSNTFSEQFAVLSSARRVRTGEGSYRATCIPAWSIIKAALGSETAAPPLLTKVKVGDGCQNPSTGNRYIIRHECVVTTTGVYRNPRTPDDNQHDSPCDREPALSEFCNNMSQDDPRGVLYTVEGAEDLGLDDSNPQQIVVRFTPGQRFKICARAYPDAKNSGGQPIQSIGDPGSCTGQTQQ